MIFISQCHQGTLSVFLSHSTPDVNAMTWFCTRLPESGVQSFFLCFIYWWPSPLAYIQDVIPVSVSRLHWRHCVLFMHTYSPRWSHTHDIHTSVKMSCEWQVSTGQKMIYYSCVC